MNTIQFLTHTLGLTGDIFVMLAEDLSDKPMHRAYPTGNHAMWCVGHMAVSDATFRTMIFGEPNAMEKWAGLFSGGTQPQDNASAYPAYGEVIAAFKQTRAAWAERIATLTEADLDKPSANVQEGFEPVFGTVGKALAVLAVHSMHHRGQLADIRKSLGRPPLVA